MRTYLANLHRESHDHRKRFALVVSSAFTLVILVIWIMVNFGIEERDLAESEKKEVSPISSLIGGVGATMKIFWNDFGETKGGLEAVKSQTEDYGR